MSRMLAAIVVLFSLAAVPALAQDDADTKSLEVYIGDLDRANPSDRHLLDERLSHAADKVCSRFTDDIRDREERRDRKRCIVASLEHAYTELGGSYVALSPSIQVRSGASR